ncbi:MAG: LCCL domain-containing protein, partial [Pseudomonadota bacterium]
MIFTRAAACAAILFSMLAIGVGPSKAGPPNGLTLGADATCPANLAGLGASSGVIVGCWCPGGPTSGSVWGTAIYTIDSNLCHAARHAGLIGDDGGEIWARLLDGQAA